MFDKIKSLFIIEEEDATKSKKSPPVASPKNAPTPKSKATKSTPSNNPPQSQQTTAPKGKVNEKFVNILFGAMEKNNLDGFDYMEYKQSLRSLQKMGNMDEPTMYKSAFAMAQTMGATADQLINTAGHYVKILQQEQGKFGEALANQRTKQIGGKEQAIKNAEAGIAQKKKQIEQLQKEIEATQKQVEAAKQEISGARTKVETTRQNFEVTYNKIVSQIMADVENMKKYLK